MQQVYKLITKGHWEEYCSYQKLDLSGVYHLLVQLKILPETVKGSLTSLCEWYKIDSSNQHDALADSLLTIKVYESMCDQLTKLMNKVNYNGNS